MSAEFDVFFSGQCLPGFAREDVMIEMARTFKLSEEAASQLMDGAQHRIKSGCDRATALRYREAMAAIGAQVTLTRHGEEPPASFAAKSPEPKREIKAKVSGRADFSQAAPTVPHDPAAATETEDIEDAIPWETPDTPELTEEQPLTLAPVGSVLGEAKTEEPYRLASAPAYELSEAGAIIPNLPADREPVSPDTNHLHVVSDDGA